MDPCPHCRKDNFKSTSGRTLHVKSCGSAASKLERPKKAPRRKKKNPITQKDYRIFSKVIKEVLDRLEQNADDLRRIADIADNVGHDGFAEFLRYYAKTRNKMHADSIGAWANIYSDAAFKERKNPPPWKKYDMSVKGPKRGKKK